MLKADVHEIAKPTWINVRNNRTEPIPAFACMRPVGVDDDGAIIVDVPLRESEYVVLFNGPFQIPATEYNAIGDPSLKGYGTATFAMNAPAHALCVNQAVLGGMRLGTQKNRWGLETRRNGFVALENFELDPDGKPLNKVLITRDKHPRWEFVSRDLPPDQDGYAPGSLLIYDQNIKRLISVEDILLIDVTL
jgi:hypothetical protein